MSSISRYLLSDRSNGKTSAAGNLHVVVEEHIDHHSPSFEQPVRFGKRFRDGPLGNHKATRVDGIKGSDVLVADRVRPDSKEHGATDVVAQTARSQSSAIDGKRVCSISRAHNQQDLTAASEGRPRTIPTISRSVDEAALSEFRSIFANPRMESSDLSSASAIYPLDRSVVSGAHANYAKQFVRSSTPPTSCTWPGDHESTEAAVTEGPSTQNGSATRRAKWRSIRDYLRITNPTAHGQTVFSRESIDAARSTSQRPMWRQSSNAFQHRGAHPFELDGRQSLELRSRKESSTCSRTGNAMKSSASSLCIDHGRTMRLASYTLQHMMAVQETDMVRFKRNRRRI